MSFALPSERSFLRADRMSFPTESTANAHNSNCAQIRSIVRPFATDRDREGMTMHGIREVCQRWSVAGPCPRHEQPTLSAARLRLCCRLGIAPRVALKEAKRMTDTDLHAFPVEAALSRPMIREPK